MLRLGSAYVGKDARVVAQDHEHDDFVNLSRLCDDLGALESLDDLLDLPDDAVATCISRAREAAPDLAAGDVALHCPLVRPGRVRDGGIVIEHLTPAFEQMRDRLLAMGTEKAADAANALDAQIACACTGPCIERCDYSASIVSQVHHPWKIISPTRILISVIYVCAFR